ncbi:MAG TPA: GNAT family N-acetyltransferase [Candidatus Paceibacterota bacterium]
MKEFGKIIPWLAPLRSIAYSTNARYFRDTFLSEFNCDEEDIIPYQLTDNDPGEDFIGGIWHFPKSPEKFIDSRNCEVAERLAFERYRYISCLHVRDVRRGKGSGRLIMRSALDSILKNHGSVWGVVSERDLVPWYQTLGAEVLSARQNKDNLWIVSWDESSGERLRGRPLELTVDM